MAPAARLRIGIDARGATDPLVGRSRVVQELLRALADRADPHRYLLYAREPWDKPLDDRFGWRLIRARDPWWHLRAARAASRECDVFLSCNSYLTTWFTSIPSVLIVYDLVAFQKGAHARRRSVVIERLTLGHAVRRSAGFVAISEATAAEFLQRFPSASNRTTVVPLAASGIFTARPAAPPDEELPEPGFVLAVGTLEPRKNLPRLVAAYAKLPESLQQAHPLVVVGQLGWQVTDTVQALGSLGERCRILGRVSDRSLAELYRRCGVFCYPSLAEGFGLPVLEGMSCGAAVITSNRSSLPEVGGDGVEYVDPLDVDDIARTLERLLREPTRRAELGQLGFARSGRFSWERTADGVLAVLAEAASRAGLASRRR